MATLIPDILSGFWFRPTIREETSEYLALYNGTRSLPASQRKQFNTVKEQLDKYFIPRHKAKCIVAAVFQEDDPKDTVITHLGAIANDEKEPPWITTIALGKNEIDF
ncbi:unnamed protein product [Caretta caretta]